MAQNIKATSNNNSNINEENLFNVTLVCEAKSLKAHKLVLSACSSLFEKLLSENPCDHPIIIIHGIKYPTLQNVIEFVYSGTLNISKDNLEDVFACAETLKIKVLQDLMAGITSPPKAEKECANFPNYWPNKEVLESDKQQTFQHNSNCNILPIEESYMDTNIPESTDFDDIPISQLLQTFTEDLTGSSSKSNSQQKKQSPSYLDHKKKSLSHANKHSRSSSACSSKKQVNISSLGDSRRCHQNSLDRSKQRQSISETEVQTTEGQQSTFELVRKKQLQDSQLDYSSKHHQDSLNSLSSSSECLDKEHHLSSLKFEFNKKHQKSFTSLKKQHPESFHPHRPTPSLPIVLCERMISVTDDDPHFTTLLASSKHSHVLSSEEQRKVEMKKENEKKNEESGNEGQVEVPENESLQKAEELNKKVLMKKEYKLKKIKRPYVRTPLAIRQTLYKIEKSPSGLRIYGCKTCPFESNYIESLKRHIIAKHEKVRNFKCDQCSYAATLKQHVKRHKIEVHEHVRKFNCQLCPYKAVLKAGLQRHIRTVHEKKKPFLCEKCGFRSSSQVNVRKHIIAVHEKRRDYMCDFCTYRCAQSSGLKRHIRLVHKKVKQSKM